MDRREAIRRLTAVLPSSVAVNLLVPEKKPLLLHIDVPAEVLEYGTVDLESLQAMVTDLRRQWPECPPAVFTQGGVGIKFIEDPRA